MQNRCKTLLRDHSVPGVTWKACPRHYSASAVPETLTIWGPKRPPINGGESDLRGICSTGRQQIFQFQSIWLKTGIKSRKYLWVSSRRSISKQILNRGYHSIKLWKEGQKGHPSKQIIQKAFQIILRTQGWTSIEKTQWPIARITKIQEKYSFAIFYLLQSNSKIESNTAPS